MPVETSTFQEPFMPYELTTFNLPGGARCVRMEWTGTAVREEADAAIKEIKSPPIRGLPILIQTEKMVAMTPEARSIFGGRSDIPETEWMAIVVNNPILRVTANFIMRVNKDWRRRQLFSSEAEAIQWLNERVREDAA